MNAIKNIIGFISLFLVMNSTVQAVTIYIDDANPPFMYKKDGAGAGFYPILITAIFNEMGEDLVIKALPWKRTLEGGKNDDSGIGGIYKNADRLKIYDYSDALFTETITLFMPTNKLFDFQSTKDLAGKNIGTITGWSYGDEFDNDAKAGSFRVLPVKADKNNFQKLGAGRLDAAMALKISGAFIAKELGIESKVIAAEKSMVENNTYVAFGKSANSKALVDRFNKALNKMKESGKYSSIYDNFVNGK